MYREGERDTHTYTYIHTYMLAGCLAGPGLAGLAWLARLVGKLAGLAEWPVGMEAWRHASFQAGRRAGGWAWLNADMQECRPAAMQAGYLAVSLAAPPRAPGTWRMATDGTCRRGPLLCAFRS